MRDGDDSGLLDAAETLNLNLDTYRSELAELALGDQLEREFFETLRSIMAAFVEYGFTVDVCGLIFNEFNESSGGSVADGKVISSPTMETPSTSHEVETAP
jgi:hypothetical protein